MTEKPLATAWPSELAWIIPLLRLEAKQDGGDDAHGGPPAATPSTHGVLVGSVRLDRPSREALEAMVHQSLNYYRVPDPLTSEHLLVRFNRLPRCLSTTDEAGTQTLETHIELRILPGRPDA